MSDVRFGDYNLCVNCGKICGKKAYCNDECKKLAHKRFSEKFKAKEILEATKEK